MGMMLLATLWGLSEASLFFIVPDVLLTCLGINDLRRGLLACLFTLGGALLGGILMYRWGQTDSATALTMLEKLPAISSEMVARVRSQLLQDGPLALFLGPMSGAPYKLYAVQAALAEVPLMTFIALSIPARALRFFVLTTLFHSIGRRLLGNRSKRTRIMVLLLAWSLFYGVFFTFMPN